MKATSRTNFPKDLKPALIYFRLSLLIGISAMLPGEAKADTAGFPPSSPSVGLTYQVLLPSGKPRVYLDKEGPTYWHDGLPVAVGDQIQVRADLAGGTQPMARLQAKIDRRPDLVSSTAPWVVLIDTKTLSLGTHTLDVQASLGGGKKRVAKRSDSFTLVSTLVDATPKARVVSSVKGAEQVLSQGNVTSVPLPSDSIKVPLLLSAGQSDGNALVTLDFDTVDTASPVTGSPVLLDQALSVRVRPQFASSARTYVFSLARDGVVFYTSSTLLSVNSTRIRLQPKTHDQDGLLPGTVHLFVWGVDDSGNYGPVSDIALDVRQPGSMTLSEH